MKAAKGEKKKKMKGGKDTPQGAADEEGRLPHQASSLPSASPASGLGGLPLSLVNSEHGFPGGNTDSVLEEVVETMVPHTVLGPSPNFFCLLRDVVAEFPDAKASTAR